MPGPYELDQLVYLNATFTTGGTVEDPSAITLTIKKATNPIVSYAYPGAQIERISKGVYRLAVTTNIAGIWKYRWKGAGLVVTSGQCEFTVKRASA